jgi:hypothetical protein
MRVNRSGSIPPRTFAKAATIPHTPEHLLERFRPRGALDELSHPGGREERLAGPPPEPGVSR